MFKHCLTAMICLTAGGALAQAPARPAPATIKAPAKIAAKPASKATAPSPADLARIMGLSLADARLIAAKGPFKTLKAAAAVPGLTKAGQTAIQAYGEHTPTLVPRDKAKINALIDD
jgi:hypothetical protein